jgi:hypothetical protein
MQTLQRYLDAVETAVREPEDSVAGHIAHCRVCTDRVRVNRLLWSLTPDYRQLPRDIHANLGGAQQDLRSDDLSPQAQPAPAAHRR